MLSYPSINKKIINTPIYAFDKLDGSNIRVEWSKKSGFHKYGTRTRLLSPNEELGEAISIFEQDFSKPLQPIMKKLRTERITLFLEFYGSNSFAGSHQEEQHYLSLFDVSIFKKGFMLPKEFLDAFEGVVPTPELLYTGNPNSDFINDVKTGNLKNMTFEGVVCKSQKLTRNKQVKFKVKNQEWLDKLKIKCGENKELYNLLA